LERVCTLHPSNSSALRAVQQSDSFNNQIFSQGMEERVLAKPFVRQILPPERASTIPDGGIDRFTSITFS